MLFADPRNITQLYMRVACRPLTSEERALAKRVANDRLSSIERFPRSNGASKKQIEHLRRIVEDDHYLDQIEVHDHVGESWDLPR